MLDGSDLSDDVKGELQEHYDKTGGMAADLGGRQMLPGENMAADQAEAARQQAIDYAAQASQVMGQALTKGYGYGATGVYAEQAMRSMKTVSQRLEDGPEEDTGPMVFPGGVYIAHLAKRMQKLRKERKEAAKDDALNIYTDALGALKTAIAALGIASDRNPSGMPIDIKEAKKIWFGSKAPEKYEENEWRSLVEMGDSTLDPKRSRRFVNHDGSTTWELLNEDKTVASRFTMGEYKGTKVFTQGGYNKFAEVLKEARGKLGPDQNAEFNAVRGRLNG